MEVEMERYDIAIIGTGPAGLEAAITAKIRNKKIILFGNKNLSLKVEKAHTIQNYLGLPDIGGEELKAAYEAHLKAMDIEIPEDADTSLRVNSKLFRHLFNLVANKFVSKAIKLDVRLFDKDIGLFDKR